MRKPIKVHLILIHSPKLVNLASVLDTIQDFLCELGMKPRMQVLKKKSSFFHYTMSSSDLPSDLPFKYWLYRGPFNAQLAKKILNGI